jgi:hypothetical protein
MGNPLNYNRPFCLRTAKVIRALLEKERGLTLSKSSVCRVLGHLGLSPQRPVYKSYKQDPDKVRGYLSEVYPVAVAEAKKHGARLYFVDEAAALVSN